MLGRQVLGGSGAASFDVGKGQGQGQGKGRWNGISAAATFGLCTWGLQDPPEPWGTGVNLQVVPQRRLQETSG